ncbi:MAG: hypothetical protein Q8K78_14520, partial [Planctomycetaceae bacterium]|nr:hypothetical protein [Planctomycetaceae bacterium]
LVLMNFELQFFHQVANSWNRSPQAWDIFPEFLRMVYENRVIKAPPVSEEDAVSWPATLPFSPPAFTPRKVA